MIFSPKHRLKIVQKKQIEAQRLFKESEKRSIDYGLYYVLRCILYFEVL